ncbi:MAG: hypothetical protein ACTH3G_12010 [Citricoccus sp.]
MRSPESPRPAHARPSRRPSIRPFTGATGGSLGEDILLARHGDQIFRLRQEHRTGLTVATLRDGTSDSAPNRIDGGTLALDPTERARLGWATLTNDGDPESLRELRFLGRLSAIWIAVSVLLGLLMVWGMATLMEPATAEQLMSSYFQTTTFEAPSSTP